MSKIAKVKVKKLPCPVKTIISINVKTWLDKVYGNTYASARIIINNDYDNVLILPMKNRDTHINTLLDIAKEHFNLKIKPYTAYDGRVIQGNIVQDKSILVIETTKEVTKAECKSFGIK